MISILILIHFEVWVDIKFGENIIQPSTGNEAPFMSPILELPMLTVGLT